MYERIRQLERDAGPNDLPPDIVMALSAMKEEIGALHAEMENIRNDVSAALRTIQEETAAMLAHVAEAEQQEQADGLLQQMQQHETAEAMMEQELGQK